MEETGKPAKAIQQQKTQLIQQFLELDKIIEGYNEQKYQVCCEIEKLNLQLQQLEKQQQQGKQASKPASTPASGMPSPGLN